MITLQKILEIVSFRKPTAKSSTEELRPAVCKKKKKFNTEMDVKKDYKATYITKSHTNLTVKMSYMNTKLRKLSAVSIIHVPL